MAHGWEKDSSLTNNQGQDCTADAAMKLLEAIDAQNADRLLFFGCYSAMEKHIAPAWKKRHPHQATYGGQGDVAKPQHWCFALVIITSGK